ncbi:hypothetical protein [Sandarakinorhabdus sp. DWP1-3-1]|uniref:hypothetical protein n=1 Tax=Sandarakinorhabdus sp. DWP1-3-1 TaxID=2804627 RepID=UPI003CFA49C8
MTESGKVAIAVAVIGVLGTLAAKLIDTGGMPSAAPAAPPPPGLAGTWTDKDGDALVIVQTGSNFAVTRWSFAGFVSAGGTVIGRDIQLDYRTDSVAGHCSGALAGDGRSVTLACTEPGNSYAQTLTRGA